MYSLQPRLSTEREIVLDDVDFTTTGHYRCEVSGDAPMFQTASNEGILYVVGKYFLNIASAMGLTGMYSKKLKPRNILGWTANSTNIFIIFGPIS